MKKKILLGLLVISCSISLVGCAEDPFYKERQLIKKGVTKKTWYDTCPNCSSSKAVKVILENQIIVKECEKSSCSYYIRGELNEKVSNIQIKEGEE